MQRVLSTLQRKMTAQRLVALYVLFAASMCACADSQHSAQSQNEGFTVLKADKAAAPLPDSAAGGTEIELKGEEVCLRSKPRKDGSVPLDCAVGFRGDDDRFYGLRAADPTKIEWGRPMQRRTRVIGKLIPSRDDRYEESGMIVYTSIQPIDDPKVVTGTFACLMHGVPNTADADECRPILKTDGGLYWGLDLQALKTPLTDGDRLSLEAEILQDLPGDWGAWASFWSRNRIEGVLQVTRLQRVRQ